MSGIRCSVCCCQPRWCSFCGVALFQGGGPRLWLSLLGSVISVVVMANSMRLTQKLQVSVAWDLGVQLALFALTIAVVARYGAERPGPDGHIHPHVVMLGAAAFGFCAVVAIGLARWAYQRRQAFDTFLPVLKQCELLAPPRRQVTITWALAVQAAAVVPFRNIGHALFLPAVAILVADGTIWFGFRACTIVGLSVFVVNYVVVVLGRLDRRLGSMIALSQALLFRGTSLVVSLLIILLAIARLANVDYVSTLLDSVQTSDIVVSFAWAAYVVSWWYDYWVGRLTSEQLIQSLGPYVSPSSVAYPIDPTSAQHAPADGRLIELHGANRFAVFRASGRRRSKGRLPNLRDVPDLPSPGRHGWSGLHAWHRANESERVDVCAERHESCRSWCSEA